MLSLSHNVDSFVLFFCGQHDVDFFSKHIMLIVDAMVLLFFLFLFRLLVQLFVKKKKNKIIMKSIFYFIFYFHLISAQISINLQEE
jgi:uncharacterized membrane protein YozB (DUF420 family)